MMKVLVCTDSLRRQSHATVLRLRVHQSPHAQYRAYTEHSNRCWHLDLGSKQIQLCYSTFSDATVTTGVCTLESRHFTGLNLMIIMLWLGGNIPLAPLDPGNMPVPVSTFKIFLTSMLRSLFLVSPLRWTLAEPGTAVRVIAHRRVCVATLQHNSTNVNALQLTVK